MHEPTPGAAGDDRQRLLDQLAELARFPEMNPGPVLRLDLSACIRGANTRAVELFGDTLVGQSWRDICREVDDALWARILASDTAINLEARMGDADYVFAHRRDAEADWVFVFGADITPQKQAERALRQSEKMATLGTLAAGVAHELNNPAAATSRAADQLREALATLEAAHAELDSSGVTQAGRDLLAQLARQAKDRATRHDQLNALSRADLESEIESWLESHGVEDPMDLAPHLVAQGLREEDLEAMLAQFDPPALGAALRWAGAAFPVYTLVHEVGQGAQRISEIVRALKSYSFLGQAPVQPVDVHEALENTLVILRNKLKVGITVHRDYCTDMPYVPAHGGELNQAWTNILDNAIDAMEGTGEIRIRTRRRDEWAQIEIADTGPGIPPEIRGRIFDPFFTTKAPGKGVGLGLSTTYSIITEKHKGEIRVDPGPNGNGTLFTIRLPLDRPNRDIAVTIPEETEEYQIP